MEEKKGFFGKLVSGLTKTRNSIVSGLDSIFSGFSHIDDDFYEELEEILIMSDIGVNTTMEIIDKLKEQVKELKIKEPEDCKELLIKNIEEQMDLGENAYDFENEKSVVMVIGVNGVGKSSLTGVLASESNDLGVIIDTDKITASLGGDKIKGGKAAIERINNSLAKGINFTQETTLSGSRILKTIKRARELDYFIRLYYVGVNSADESMKRIRNRVEKGGHDIPEQDVKRRYNKRFEDLVNILPYCNEVKFYDNENGFVEKAEYKNGELITKSKSIPEWIKDLKQYLDNK